LQFANNFKDNFILATELEKLTVFYSFSPSLNKKGF